jgi:hypothetical protein
MRRSKTLQVLQSRVARLSLDQVAHLRAAVLVGRLFLEAFRSPVVRPIYAGY